MLVSLSSPLQGLCHFMYLRNRLKILQCYICAIRRGASSLAMSVPKGIRNFS
uniref:Uncharacterized protein n=1 Tax=Arundo donax TaxID=35708 RepID=A0A0A9EYQ8_ARUDO